MTKGEKRSAEIEALYKKAKTGKACYMEDLYNELLPLFMAYYVKKTKKIICFDDREYQQDAAQIFYIHLNTAVQEYIPGKCQNGFISFVHYYFQKTLLEIFKVHNEFQKVYKPYQKIEVEEEKLN